MSWRADAAPATLSPLKVVLGGGAPQVDPATTDLVQAAIQSLELLVAETKRISTGAAEGRAGAQKLASEAHAVLEEAAKSGVLPSTGRWGQRFARSADGGKSADYKACKSHAEKQQFRANWATVEWNKVKITLTEDTREDEVDGKVGTYMCFKRIWDKEGRDSEGYEATVTDEPNCVFLRLKRPKGSFGENKCKRIDICIMLYT